MRRNWWIKNETIYISLSLTQSLSCYFSISSPSYCVSMDVLVLVSMENYDTTVNIFLSILKETSFKYLRNIYLLRYKISLSSSVCWWILAYSLCLKKNKQFKYLISKVKKISLNKNKYIFLQKILNKAIWIQNSW